ncbi:MAG: lipid-A-disaccharide synthase N-terminal domain-containing protein [Thermococcus sp.]|uniref:lipid-A-disaccharide synthase N-terminal domain-containing protein n=1 Tax=Thermococcus sp. TaxID=35749 RepID=UPI0026117854|nr:lipid-A-disaccharide synthase N-terminal domain-containing protein [Thermococcus sp.]MCD6141066.1 lipid-A-disaccharide synthase N-terminal domain-containing protein [Thermococcus sp.]
MKEVVGLIGMLLLVSSWAPQTLETIKNKKCPLNLEFIIIYVTASLLLTIYSYLIRDPVFLALNSLATLQSGINLYVKLRYK